MRKILSAALAILLIFSLVACSSSNTGTNSPAPASAPAQPEASASPSTPASSSPSAAPVSSVKPEVGFFDKNTDYSKNKKYKVTYMVTSVSVLNQGFSDGFKLWAGRTNCEFSFWSANADNDLFVNTMETFADQGYNGFILDPDTTIAARVYDVAKEYNLTWMPGMAAIRDDAGKLLHPFVGFDFPAFGKMMAEWLIDYAKKTWKLTDFSKVAFVGTDFSVSPQLHDRVPAEQQVWNTNFPNLKDNFMIVDGVVTGKLDSDTMYNMVSATMAKNPQYEYWLIAGQLDDYADGCARAAEAAGKADKTVVTDMGGTGLIAHWDAGEDSCWKSALYTAQPIYGEPIFMGLYAMMNGEATAETLWPEWVDHSKGEKYASMLMTSYALTIDTYKEYMEWVDNYTGVNSSPYDKDYKGTQFDAKGTPPASFAG